MKFSSQADKQIWLTYTKSGESFSLTKMHGWYSLVSGITGAVIATPAPTPTAQDPVQAAVDAIIASAYSNPPLDLRDLDYELNELCRAHPELKDKIREIIQVAGITNEPFPDNEIETNYFSYCLP